MAAEMAYQPIHADGRAAHGVAFDLAGLASGCSTCWRSAPARRTADLWQDWVVNDDQQRQLASASVGTACLRRHRRRRPRTGSCQSRSGPRWERGSSTMRARHSTSANDVLRDRDRIADAAGATWTLAPPDTLRAAFEGEGGLSAAAASRPTPKLDALAALASAAAAAGRRARAGRDDRTAGHRSGRGAGRRRATRSSRVTWSRLARRPRARPQRGDGAARRRSRAGRWSPAARILLLDGAVPGPAVRRGSSAGAAARPLRSREPIDLGRPARHLHAALQHRPDRRPAGLLPRLAARLTAARTSPAPRSAS